MVWGGSRGLLRQRTPIAPDAWQFEAAITLRCRLMPLGDTSNAYKQGLTSETFLRMQQPSTVCVDSATDSRGLPTWTRTLDGEGIHSYIHS
jgi:hypothetical protein